VSIFQHFNPRIIQTVPAKEPRMNAVPLKSVLKKPKSASDAAKNGHLPNHNHNNNNNNHNDAKSNGNSR
jgi:hypothetical protein